MNINLKYIILIISIFLINKFTCVDVSSTEISCLKDIGTITQDPAIVVSTVQQTYCSVAFVTCDTDGTIIKMVVRSETTNQIQWNNLQCFTKLNNIMFYKVHVTDNFLYNVASTVKSISLSGSNIVAINTLVSPLNSLSINSLPANYLLHSSYISNVKLFASPASVIELDVDDSQVGVTSSLTGLIIAVNSIPDISDLVNLNSIDLTIGPNFIPTSYSNFSSFHRIESFSFSNTYSKMNFPFEFFESNQICTSFSQTSGLGFNALSKFIDLSKCAKRFTFSIIIPGNLFNVDGQFPISALPDESIVNIRNGNFSSLPSISVVQNCTIFSVQNSTIGGPLWPVNTFKNINSLDLTNNQLTGTIGSEWCGVDTLNVAHNLLSGELPPCIYCYLGNPNFADKFIGNGFTNYNSTPTCGHSEILLKFENVGPSFKITGKNLGNTLANFISTPPFMVTKMVSKDSFIGFFTGSIVDLKTAEIKLLVPGINFTVSITQTPPVIDSIIQTNNSFTFKGSFFSYDQTDISVTIGGAECNVLPLSTFYNFTCELSWPIKRVSAGDKAVVVKVGNTLSTNTKSVIRYTPVPCPVANCNGNGACNDDIGVCGCFNKWTTVGANICLVPSHYISSCTLVSLSTGGIIKLYGYISNQNVDLKVTIDYNSTSIGTELKVLQVFEGYIETKLNPSLIGGAKKLTVIQNGVTWIGLIYPYIESSLLCPNNCGNSVLSGKCNSTSGQCLCNQGYNGIDCQPIVTSVPVIELPPTKTDINSSTGITTLSNEQTGYQLSIVSISEIDFNGNQITGSSFNLLNSWTIVGSTDINLSIFSQIVNNATIVLTIEQIVNQDKQFSFAGNQFTVLKDGIKITLSISNWNYKSSLNNIQIQMQSDLTVLNGGENDCNQNNDGLVVESSSNSNSLNSNVNYLKITKNNKVLYGRFQDKVLSNNVPTIVTTTLLSKDDKTVLLGLNLPHCDECILDPDFSVLVSPDFKSSDSCESSSNSKPWLIPVAVVVPVVGAALIITAIVVLVKKNSIGLRVGLRNISLKSFKDRSNNKK